MASDTTWRFAQMAKKTSGDALIERLADWGVDTVFGLPGDGINGIMEGLRRHQDRVRFVLVHHEEAAAFMATTHPGRQCIAFVGDGGFAMLMAEFDTACRYDLPIKVVICNNSSLGQILWEQMVLGYPEFGVRFSSRADFSPWAKACGGFGARVDKVVDLEPAVAEAFSYDGPALIDVTVNADEPPMPGKVQYEQAKGFAKAFLSGQPRKATIASTLFRDKIASLRS
jgi:pyruvate dehydrogenase (quinone)/pyruvate oxidase